MPESTRKFVVRVAVDPAHPDADEVLELVLAGASLDIDLAVVFEGPACGLLMEPWARGWRQLIDFDLATLYRQSEPGSVTGGDLKVDAIDDAGLARLCAERVEIRV